VGHRRAALLAAAIFALHPVQTEAVAYVSGRTDLLMTAGALLSWAALLASGPRCCAASVRLAGGVAMLSKESGFALALLWPWLAWRLGRDGRERLTLIGPGMLLALLLLALRPGDLLLPGLTKGVSGLAAVGQALAVYAGVLIWPEDLQIDRLTPLPDGALALAVGFAALGAGVTLAIWGLTRRGPAADWSAWSIAFYLPVANLLALYPAIADRVLFTPEHNLYAPLAGLAVLIGMGIERLQPQGHRVARGAAVAVLALWAVRGAARTRRGDEERCSAMRSPPVAVAARLVQLRQHAAAARREGRCRRGHAGAAEARRAIGHLEQPRRCVSAPARLRRRRARLSACGRARTGRRADLREPGDLFVARGDLRQRARHSLRRCGSIRSVPRHDGRSPHCRNTITTTNSRRPCGGAPLSCVGACVRGDEHACGPPFRGTSPRLRRTSV
jgi:hypothetical protein